MLPHQINEEIKTFISFATLYAFRYLKNVRMNVHLMALTNLNFAILQSINNFH